jgi:hypothetical protein
MVTMITVISVLGMLSMSVLAVGLRISRLEVLGEGRLAEGASGESASQGVVTRKHLGRC